MSTIMLNDSSANSTYAKRTARLVGEEIRGARRRLGLDQDDVALVAGVSRRTVYAIEHGKPTVRLDALLPVLRAVGLDFDVVRHVAQHDLPAR